MEIEALQKKLLLVKGAWKGIAERIGVAPSWIGQFVRDEIDNPGYRHVDGLIKFFKELGE